MCSLLVVKHNRAAAHMAKQLHQVGCYIVQQMWVLLDSAQMAGKLCMIVVEYDCIM